MRLTGLERAILEAAVHGEVLENVQESAPAVGAVYRRLDADGMIAADWFSGDALPLEVAVTPVGRVLLRSR